MGQAPPGPARRLAGLSGPGLARASLSPGGPARQAYAGRTRPPGQAERGPARPGPPGLAWARPTLPESPPPESPRPPGPGPSDRDNPGAAEPSQARPRQAHAHTGPNKKSQFAHVQMNKLFVDLAAAHTLLRRLWKKPVAGWMLQKKCIDICKMKRFAKAEFTTCLQP